jgi:hypothetical protein
VQLSWSERARAKKSPIYNTVVGTWVEISMEVTDKRERFLRYRKIRNDKDCSQVMDSRSRNNQRSYNHSQVNTMQRPNVNKKSESHSSTTPRFPLVNTKTYSKLKKGKDAGTFMGIHTKWNTNDSIGNKLFKQKSTTDVYTAGSRGFHSRDRTLCPSKNRVSYPLMSSVDRRLLQSIGSYEHCSNLTRKHFFSSDSALAIRSIELKPRHKKKTPLPKTATLKTSSTPNDLDTKLGDPLFPSLTGNTNFEPLYMYSSPLFSLSDEVDSLAPFLDGISLSPPPPSELSFSSPSQSPLFFSPNYDFPD